LSTAPLGLPVVPEVVEDHRGVFLGRLRVRKPRGRAPAASPRHQPSPGSRTGRATRRSGLPFVQAGRHQRGHDDVGDHQRSAALVQDERTPGPARAC
jgi:hypothetical protein